MEREGPHRNRGLSFWGKTDSNLNEFGASNHPPKPKTNFIRLMEARKKMIRLRQLALPRWIKVAARIFRILIRLTVDALYLLMDWMDSKIFQALRLASTIIIVWLVWKHIDVQKSAAVGFNSAEILHFAKAVVIVSGIGMAIGLIWSGTFCDGAAGVLLRLLDDPDNRPIKEDPMEKLGRLMRAGKVRRARWLCRRLLWKNEGSRDTLKTILVHLKDRPEGTTGPRYGRGGGGK